MQFILIPPKFIWKIYLHILLKNIRDILSFILRVKILHIKKEKLLIFLILLYCLFPYFVISSIFNGNIEILLMNTTLLNAIINISCLIILVYAIYLYGVYSVFESFHVLLEFLFTWLVIGGFIVFNIWFIFFNLDFNYLFLIKNGVINIVNNIRLPILTFLIIYLIIIQKYKLLFNIFLRISLSILFIFFIFFISNEILSLADTFVFMMAGGGSGGGSGGDPNGNSNGNPNGKPHYDPFIPKKSGKFKYSVTYYNDPTAPNGSVPLDHMDIANILPGVGLYDSNTVDELQSVLPNLPRADVTRILEHERTQWELITNSAQQIPFDGTVVYHPGSPYRATVVPSRVTEFLEYDYASTIRENTVRTLFNSNVQGRAPVTLRDHHSHFLRAFRMNPYSTPQPPTTK